MMINYFQDLFARYPTHAILSSLSVGGIAGVSGLEATDLLLGVILKFVSIIALSITAAVGIQSFIKGLRK